MGTLELCGLFVAYVLLQHQQGPCWSTGTQRHGRQLQRSGITNHSFTFPFFSAKKKDETEIWREYQCELSHRAKIRKLDAPAFPRILWANGKYHVRSANSSSEGAQLLRRRDWIAMLQLGKGLNEGKMVKLYKTVQRTEKSKYGKIIYYFLQFH